MSTELSTPQVTLGPDRRADMREVYFIRAKTLGLIKIGIANRAADRLQSLQTMSPDALEILGVLQCSKIGIVEQQMHQRFKHLRLHGEWFQPGEDLLAFIAEKAQPAKSKTRLSLLDRRLKAQERRLKAKIRMERRIAESQARWAKSDARLERTNHHD